MGMDFQNIMQQVQNQIPVGRQYNPNNNQNQQMQQFQRSLPSMDQSSYGGKGGGYRPQGMQGNVTYSATSGQQQMGSPNPYPNTVGMGDNQGNQPMPRNGGGKGEEQ